MSDSKTPKLLAHIRANAVKLTGLSYSLESYQPDALFLVAVDRSAEDVLQMCRQNRGKEWREGLLKFARASFDDQATRKVLADASWVPAGKASFVRAIELVDSIKEEFSKPFSDAFEILANAP